MHPTRTPVFREGANHDTCWTMPTAITQVLILGDDQRLESVLTESLNGCAVRYASAAMLEQAGLRIEDEPPELIFADLDATGTDFLDWMARLRQSGFGGSIVVLAGKNSMRMAREALDRGATGYLRKPVEGWEVELAVRNSEARSRPIMDRSDPEADARVYGSSPEIQAVLKIVDQVARRGDHLTLIGEAGAGKRLIGRLIHNSSARSHARFMSLGCSGLSESVMDRELFGYRDQHGAGGGGRHPGCLEKCDGGTLLLDEVGALDRRTQGKLLRFLTRGSVKADAHDERALDVRIIATSGCELEEPVRAGRFNRELFDRLQRIQISVPALRQRRSDIPIIVDQYVRISARMEGKVLNGVSASALARLMQYDWPGNVRELKDMIGHAVSDAEGPVLGDKDIPSLPEPRGSNPDVLVLGATIHEVEKEAILRTLEAADGSTSRAARILQMSVRKIQYKLKEYRQEAATAVRLETVRSVSQAQTHRSKKNLPLSKTDFVAPSDRSE